jgi:electron transport complex protein RnfD
MLDVIIALLPAVVAAWWFFRTQAVIIVGVCVISCVVTEWLCNVIRKKPNSLGDLSAVVTGIILALSLPAAIPFWAAIIGSVFAIAIAKMVFGGLGSNIFNPAMAARAFLAVSFGMLMTTWTVPATIGNTNMTLSATSDTPITQATPLAWSKEAIKEKAKADVANNMLKESFIGGVGGCLGETSAAALLIGGAYLLIRKTIALHIPLAVLLSGFAFAAIAYLINSEKFVSPLLHLTTGGMLLCAFFIATDPVTAPLSSKGMWIFGAGLGTLIMLIRIVGEYPEGVMFAVLIMNAVAPLIDRFCKIIPAGGVIANE